ncbi:MAG: cytochrome c oxidase subunit II, partial [Alphaproteobacteria bacterium]|nr:cytochrome c oxidase subunit II [Alphaproteobacteria bacterium]
AIPGRTTMTWFKAEKEGVFYGQCSELCGKDHANMPIAVRVVSDDVYAKWIEAWKEEDEDAARDLLSALPPTPDVAAKKVASIAEAKN